MATGFDQMQNKLIKIILISHQLPEFKGVIQSKKTFDMCCQTQREPHCHQQN